MGGLPRGRSRVAGTVTQQEFQPSPRRRPRCSFHLLARFFFSPPPPPRPLFSFPDFSRLKSFRLAPAFAGSEAGGESVQEGERHPGGERERGAADAAPAGVRRRGGQSEQRRAPTGESRAEPGAVCLQTSGEGTQRNAIKMSTKNKTTACWRRRGVVSAAHATGNTRQSRV